MLIRPFEDSDVQRLIDLTIQTFRPFYEGYVYPLYGDKLFRHLHGQWEQDYRDEVPTLHDPAAGRYIAVAEVGEAIAGYVSWKTGDRPHHGEVIFSRLRLYIDASRWGADSASMPLRR